MLNPQGEVISFSRYLGRTLSLPYVIFQFVYIPNNSQSVQTQKFAVLRLITLVLVLVLVLVLTFTLCFTFPFLKFL